MSDNLGYTPGAGATIAADDIGGVHFQRVKLAIGADGANDGDASSATPLPVSLTSVPLPTDAATSANQGTEITLLTAIGALLAGTLVVGDGGGAITVDGTVAVTDGGGSLTIDGTVAATQSGAWIISANSGVDIGDVTINNASGGAAVNVQDGGNSLTVDGTFWQTTQPISAAALPLPSGAATSGAQLPNSHDVTIDNATGAAAVNIQDGGNSITVDGAVAATQSGSWVLAANSGVDIGDVTINNTGAGAAVNIQDGGNSITVDGPLTDADLRAAPIDVTGSFSATTAATATEDDPTYAEGDDAAALSQDLGGRLRAKVHGVVGETPESYIDGEIKPLSLTTAGRLRVSVVSADTYLELFQGNNLFTTPIDLTDLRSPWEIGNSPWST